jgi:hypothetical protein
MTKLNSIEFIREENLRKFTLIVGFRILKIKS